MTEYQKIPGPFNRYAEGPDRNKVIPWDWSSGELSSLVDTPWIWTEKIDGTNIRVIWDGHKVTFGGRTDNAQIPAKLLEHLIETFTEELMEQVFKDTSAVLYGEGHGAGIQKGGGNYRPDQSFILFDVKIDGWWLRRADMCQIGDNLGIGHVGTYGFQTLRNMIYQVALEPVNSLIMSNHPAEGVVGTTATGLLDRSGKRIIVKLKSKDLLGVNL